MARSRIMIVTAASFNWNGSVSAGYRHFFGYGTPGLSFTLEGSYVDNDAIKKQVWQVAKA